MSSPIKLKQKLSPKAAAAKKRRDIAMAKTPVRKAKKAQNQRIGQRSDSDIHHKNDGSVIRTSIKKNRGNFGRGTKNENNMKKKSAPTKFGPKRKTTKKKLLVDPLDIKGKITKVADAADKEMKNLISNVKTIAKTDVPKAIAGDAKKVLNKVGDFIKTSKSTKVKGTGFFKMKRQSDGSMAKLKDQSFMKRMKMMNEASPMMFGPKRKTTKKKLPVDPLNVGGKITKVADAADKEMKNLIKNVRNIAKTDVPRAIAGDAKKLLNKVGKFVKTNKSRKTGGIFGK